MDTPLHLHERGTDGTSKVLPRRVMMSVRRLAAIGVCVLATVVLVVAVILCITIVLLPVGLAVGYGAIRMYRWGVQLVLPRSADVKRSVDKRARAIKKDLHKRVRWVKKHWIKV